MNKVDLRKTNRIQSKKALKRLPLRTRKNELLQDATAANHFVTCKGAASYGEKSVFNQKGAADKRVRSVDRRIKTTDQRKRIADRRERGIDRREKGGKVQIEPGRDKVADEAIAESDLREANERLIIATINAQTMKEAAEKNAEQMTHMAEHDFLTGLPNRALLSDRLAQSIALAKRHGKKTALMYLDLDNFKDINDSLGHLVGDHLLQSVARRLQACVRVSDTISRQGGDEFVVLLNEIDDVKDTVNTAEKLIRAIAKPHLIDGHRLHVTLSVGISLYPGHGADAETVIRNADTAMYHAKKNGRNNYQMFTSDMNDHAVARQSVEQSLHHALEYRRFVLHYQPKVNLETETIIGAEALIRLRESDHQLIAPAKFVGIAEECGLILPIGRWALNEACRQTQSWLESGLDIGQIAVNVSASELRSKQFIEGVLTTLRDTGLDPRRLELELTESVLMQDTDQTTAILIALKDNGIQIAVDDFGTGYSSLSFLLRFPIDTIKIDRSFVQKVKGAAGESVVTAVIAIGRSLKQKVVAEGVETPEQLSFLRAQQCGEGQGFHFSHPMSAEDFTISLGKSMGI